MTEKLNQLITQYKDLLKADQNQGEIYKWKAVKIFQDEWDSNSEDFSAMYERAIRNKGNLIYQNSYGFLIKLARNIPEEFRQLIMDLYDEKVDLETRILNHQKNCDFLVVELRKMLKNEKINHQQDERTIAFLLTMRFPEKFYFYKDQIYQKVCKFFDIETKKAGEKLGHFIEFSDSLISKIEEDSELIDLVHSCLNEESFKGDDKRIIIQDIFYRTLIEVYNHNDRLNSKCNYWLFQGNPELYDFETALRENRMEDYLVSAHKDKIKVGDKVILWISGEKAGCYALAEVTAEPTFIENSPDDDLWKDENSDNIKAKIMITHNFIKDPILKKEIEEYQELDNLNQGHRGTNFTATELEYEALKKIGSTKNENKKYWIYSPGSNASLWDEFYEKGIMAIGWDSLLDLKRFYSREQIEAELDKLDPGDTKKINDSLANYEFAHHMQIGDVIFAKKGKHVLLGYGVVTSEYYDDESRESYKKCRKIKWKKKGEWKHEQTNFATKTLTEITQWTDYVSWLKRRLGIEKKEKMESLSLFKLYENFLVQKRKDEIKESTIEGYVETATEKIPHFWEEVHDSIFNEYDLSFKTLLKIDQYSYKGFSGSSSFWWFMEWLISKHFKSKTINKIFYGPPGTGKTYHSVAKAIELCGIDINNKSRSEIKEIYADLCAKGRIEFVTFHQSQGYEDFIEGIKPTIDNSERSNLEYIIEDGVFKRMAVQAAFSIGYKLDKKETEAVLDFSTAFDQFLEKVEEKLSNGEIVELKSKSGGFVDIDGISSQGNLIVKHKNGKVEYTVSKARLSKLSKNIPNLNNVSNFGEKFRSIIGGSNASAFWAVLNAIEEDVSLYDHHMASIEDFSYGDRKELMTEMKNMDYRNFKGEDYVLIIDEINRGNISEIFGELITLIEPNKRLGASEFLTVTLPYSKEQFGVPHNLHIIGTMNTADRSVEALDTALRRRFTFHEMMPDPEVLRTEEVGGIRLADVLIAINQRIEMLIDRDHTIGHSYFIGIDSEEALANTFKDKIIPLLQEYFYGDYGKIGLVLGKGFIESVKNNNKEFANFNYEGNADEYKTESYQLIPIDAGNIKSAIHSLLNKKEFEV